MASSGRRVAERIEENERSEDSPIDVTRLTRVTASNVLFVHDLFSLNKSDTKRFRQAGSAAVIDA
jgi:hypothetical protein